MQQVTWSLASHLLGSDRIGTLALVAVAPARTLSASPRCSLCRATSVGSAQSSRCPQTPRRPSRRLGPRSGNDFAIAVLRQYKARKSLTRSSLVIIQPASPPRARQAGRCCVPASWWIRKGSHSRRIPGRVVWACHRPHPSDPSEWRRRWPTSRNPSMCGMCALCLPYFPPLPCRWSHLMHAR